MSYQVLARKWRPKTFSTLVGQEHVVRALTHALEQQRLHHAYLFTGTRGVGKTTLARILAKALNCASGISATPCGVCAACTEIDAGRFVDYIEMDAASNRGVDEMTQLLERASYAPGSGRFKVYVIDEVHQLSGHAFNAMLKTLEEPPEHVKFILATTDPQKIPVTVLSRCLQFNLKQMPQAAIVEHLGRILDAEGIAHEPQALRQLAKAASGSMRDALSLLDQAIAHGAGRVEETGVRDMLGTVGDDHLYAIVEAVAANDVEAMLAVADRMDARSLSFESALQDLAALLHRIALAQFAPDAITDAAERSRLTPLAARIDREFLQLAYQIVIHGRDDLPLAPDEYAGFTMTLLRLAAFRPEGPSAAAQVGREAGAAGVGVAAAAAREQEAAMAVAEASSILHQPAEPAASASPASASADEWHTLVEQLKLGGMVRELAQHCEWLALQDDLMALRLGRAHRHLHNKALQDKLQAELSRHYGRALKLAIEIGEPSAATPAQRRNGEKQERHERAVAALEQDVFVRNVIDMFDATIKESTIKPLEGE